MFIERTGDLETLEAYLIADQGTAVVVLRDTLDDACSTALLTDMINVLFRTGDGACVRLYNKESIRSTGDMEDTLRG